MNPETGPVLETRTAPSEAFYEALADDDPEDLYEHAPCGYLSTLPDGTIIKVNATFLELTGCTREELVGHRRFVDLLSPGGRIYHETHYSPLLRMQGSVHEIAVELVAADGHRVPVLLNSALRRGPDGEPSVIRTAVFDATVRRSYEQELVRARERAEEAGDHARSLAETLQASLIPPDLPDVPGADIAGVYRPAGDGTEVGGDFYDVFETADGTWALVLGDVCGKGVGAARITALARYTLRAAAMRTPRPSEALGMLNAAMLQQHADRFLTAGFLTVLRAPGGGLAVTAASGGHPLPLRVSAGGEVVAIGRPGHLLGVFDAVDIADTDVHLDPGDALVLYTDGITDARDAVSFFGEERLMALLRTHAESPASTMASAIVDEVIDGQGGVAADDIAVLVVKAE